MRKLVLPALSVAVLPALAGAQGVVTPIAPFNNPNLGAGVINVDSNSNTIVAIEQIEMRHVGGGSFQTVVTAALLGAADSKLVAGLLIMSVNPPMWLPNADLEGLNVAGAQTDEFQGSMTADGLVVVWDNYVGFTYPNMPASAQTFICQRASTAVPFSVNDVRAIAGMPAGGADPHIAQDDVGNGNVLVCFLNANGDIGKIEVDPATGLSSNQSVAATNTGQANWVFSHSPTALRDTTGAPRGLAFSEYISGQNSDGLWTEDLNDTGTPSIVAARVQSGTAYWFANPSVVGGTINWATAAAGYGDPSQFEGTFLTNTDLPAGNGSGRILAAAPSRPTAVGLGTFWSVVGIGTLAPAPYQVPPVIGDIDIFPTLGLLDLRIHDNPTGLAEWVFNGVPVINASFAMQLITLDTSTSQIYAGNSATLKL